MRRVNSETFSIVALAFVLFSIFETIKYTFFEVGINYLEQFAVKNLFFAFLVPFSWDFVPLIFGIIGLFSPARKIALVSIVLTVLNILFKLFVTFSMVAGAV